MDDKKEAQADGGRRFQREGSAPEKDLEVTRHVDYSRVVGHILLHPKLSIPRTATAYRLQT